MGDAALAAAWLLSLPPLLAPLGALPAPLPGASRAALALLPWVVLAGLPRGAPSARTSCRTPGAAPAARVPAELARLLALALGPVALAAALDRRAGLAPGTLLAVAGGGLAAAVLLARAAERAAGATPATRVAYAALWGAAVLGLPLLAWTLEQVAGGVPGLLETLAGGSPLPWLGVAAGGAPGPPPWGPVALVALLWLGTELAPRAASAEPSERPEPDPHPEPGRAP